jgi:hypothetical protein
VIRQRPAPRSHLDTGARVTLIVSKGSPFAELPSFVSGTKPVAAKAYLERSGFRVRYRWTPSWYVHKGEVIELHPSSGTRVRRPATVRIVVSSGWPRAVVPDVQSLDVDSAKRQLDARHLRYGIVYRPAHGDPPNQVASQKPLPGATVYHGTRVWLAVPRKVRWRAVFSDSGSGDYESVPFTVPARWRIRYRLDDGNDDSGATAELTWARDGDFFGFDDGSFVAESAGSMQVHRVDDGAGTYRLTVRPDADEMSWYVEVDALQ